MIDILSLLEEKTRGNLTAEERQLLEQVLFELRMRYVEVHERHVRSCGSSRSRASSFLEPEPLGRVRASRGARARECPRHVSRHRHLVRRADDRLHMRGLPVDRSARQAPASVDLRRACRDTRRSWWIRRPICGSRR